jgi:lipooligosaccharide transport system permease protein
MATSVLRITPSLLVGSRAPAVIARNLRVYRYSWGIIVSGFFEPLFYLLALGVGLGSVIGDVDGVSYAAFVAPAMLATSAMNGAVTDSTFNVFFKLKYNKIYDAVLSTPVAPFDIALGEIVWALGRGLIYSTGFLAVMLALGLVSSPWAILVLPVSVVIGFAFAGAGMAATTYMRSWQDFEWITLSIVPMFFLSATFFPLSSYPPGLQLVVRVTPLYQAVDLVRSLTTGAVHPSLLLNLAYLLVMGVIGLWVAARRLDKLLLH